MTERRSGLPPDIEFEEDPRYAVANREAWWGIGYWAMFTAVITAVSWLMGGNKPAEDLQFVLGFPAWFFWSCLVGAAAMCVLPIFVIKRFFTDLPLSADGSDDDETEGDSR